MDYSRTNKTCILFTKKFPFGKTETYIEYEIPKLVKEFDNLIIIPTEEFEYKNPRVYQFENIQIFELNNKTVNAKFLKKVFWLVQNFILLTKEFCFSRERLSTLKTWGIYNRRLVHMRAQAETFRKYFNQNEQIYSKTVIYHYWLHNSVVIQKISRVNPNLTVSRAHALDLYHKNWPSYNKFSFLQFERLKIDYCDLIFSISGHGYNHFTHYFPNHKDKFVINRLGVNDVIETNFQKTFPSEHIILTCSSLVERKRLKLMPEILKHTKLKIKWIHIGGVKGEAYNELNSLCLNYNIDFKFLGQLTTKEIFEFYRKNQVSLFCNLSYAEGIPVSLMEAAMFGIPLMATNTFGNPEIVNGENGIIIPVEFEPMKVAASIDEFFSNQTEWETKSKKSRTKFSDDFDAEKNLNQFLSKLNSLL